MTVWQFRVIVAIYMLVALMCALAAVSVDA